ncbi:MAG: hypothetical protein A2219_05680 [Elusimicrobia bacterium RIFOXYA2_FULL_50_26]|nr:MAG: hypothetical protein A2219_05680 [Elusimicrobia bacterium RIFOXYA2_FULL_50_26]
MHSAVGAMLARYNATTFVEQKNALKEIVQEIALLGLFRGGFFEKAAFYGGTALRIFYGLPRFSEDLDFSLLKKDTGFDIEHYCKVVKDEMMAYGFDVEVTKKKKTGESAVESAFIKGGTMFHLLKIKSIRPPVSGVYENELFKVKLEVDTDPPDGANFEIKYLLEPIPFSVRVFTPMSLFAGKLHAVLCRSWKSGRVKGRDLYDYIWYLSQKIPVNAVHLAHRMVQTGHLKSADIFSNKFLFSRLEEKFKSINYEQAKRDILPFIKNPDELSLWSAKFFISITRDKLEII